jgi:hypothetical protein
MRVFASMVDLPFLNAIQIPACQESVFLRGTFSLRLPWPAKSYRRNKSALLGVVVVLHTTWVLLACYTTSADRSMSRGVVRISKTIPVRILPVMASFHACRIEIADEMRKEKRSLLYHVSRGIKGRLAGDVSIHLSDAGLAPISKAQSCPEATICAGTRPAGTNIAHCKEYHQ